MANPISQMLARLSGRVITAHDSEEQKLHKTLLIFACGLMGFAAMLWLTIYHAMGIRYSATVPLIYLAVSAATLGIYIWNLNFEVFRFAQTCLYLFVPFIMQWSIGSYVTSSGVMLWALLALIFTELFLHSIDAVTRRLLGPIMAAAGKNKILVKTPLARTKRQLAPFAHAGRSVTGLFQHGWDHDFVPWLNCLMAVIVDQACAKRVTAS